MLIQSSRLLLIAAAAGALCLPALMLGQGAAAAQPQCKDQQECDLYNAILKDTNPKTKLDKLQQWQSKYPDSAFKKVRGTLLITTYAAAGQPKEAVAAAKQSLADDPKDFNALYYTMFLTRQLYGTNQQPAVLDDGEKAANALLGDLGTPPPGVTADQWAKLRPDLEVLAHVTLGFVGMQRKNWDGAEAELKKALAVKPNNSEVDYMLGFTLASKKENSAALYYYGRAASYDGEGGLSAQQRQGVQAEVQKIYVIYHGNTEGFSDLLAAAKAQPNPPDGYHIKSKAEVALASAQAQEADAEKFAKEHPELALWKNIKTQLTGADGANYFQSGMKGAKLPTLKGKVVKLEPALRPKTLILSLEDGTTPDATLKFEMPLPGKVEEGTELTFEGVPDSYTTAPFMVVFTVEKEDLHGWTGKNVAPHRPAHSAQK